MIGVSDLAIVEMSAVFGAVRLRRVIRAMRIVKMKPKEKGMIGGVPEPGDGAVDTLSRFAIDQADVFLFESLGGKCVIIKIEAAGQSPTAVQHKGTDNRSCGITHPLKGLCDGPDVSR